MSEPIYDDSRAKRLVELLRALAIRIGDLKGDKELLTAGPELLKMMGDARSELFHYEVRSTYDTPEVAENRRIVEEARIKTQNLMFGPEDAFEPDDTEDGNQWHNR
jgi:hypothetical protein